LPKFVEIGVLKDGTRFEFEQATVKKEAMNGAQVTSMVTVAANVSQGVLTKEAATEIYKTGFNMNDEEAKKITDNLNEGSVAEPTAASVMARMRASMKEIKS
jgi:hypothetical protein